MLTGDQTYTHRREKNSRNNTTQVKYTLSLISREGRGGERMHGTKTHVNLGVRLIHFLG